MWKALKLRYGRTFSTRLRGLTMKFNSYKMHSEHTMKQHLRVMSSMIRELKSTGNNLTDEQQVQAMIRSLPSSWETMCQNLTHNENIKTFDDVVLTWNLKLSSLKQPSRLVLCTWLRLARIRHLGLNASNLIRLRDKRDLMGHRLK